MWCGRYLENCVVFAVFVVLEPRIVVYYVIRTILETTLYKIHLVSNTIALLNLFITH